MLFRFTGLGWLGLVLPVLTFVAGLAVAIPVGGDIDTSGLVMVVAFLLGAAAHRLVARRLNSTGTGEDRRWHDRHTLNELPIQNLVGLYLVVALILISTLVGGLTSPVVAWAVFLGALVLALVVWMRHRSLRRQRSVADRQELARVRGWRYKKTDPGLPRRWKALYGQGTYQMAPFGVLGGELDGFPFTVFDSAKGPRTTTWVLHLPVAYPRLALGEPSWVTEDRGAMVIDGASARDVDRVIAQRRAGLTGEDLQPDTADDSFGRALLTPHVRHATLAYQLVGWQIEDRDLILAVRREIPHSAGEVVQVAERLVALANLFPTEVAHSHGRRPDFDVPLPVGATRTTA
jgi:hypothetical protein